MAQKDGIMFVFELFKYIYSQKSICITSVYCSSHPPPSLCCRALGAFEDLYRKRNLIVVRRPCYNEIHRCHGI